MLNELYQLSKALERNGISISGLHSDIKSPAVGNGLIVYLSEQGIDTIEISESKDFAQLWYFSKGNHGSFPVIRIQEPLLFDPNDSKQSREVQEKKKLSLFEKWEWLINDLNTLSIFPDDEKKTEQKAWSNYLARLKERGTILKSENDPELLPFLSLMDRFYKYSEIKNWRENLKEKIRIQVEELKIKEDEKINSKTDKRIKEFDFYFTLLKGKWENKENKAKCGIQIFLELSDFENFNKSIRQSKEIVSRNLSQKVEALDSKIKPTNKVKCAISGYYDEIEKEKLPNPKLPLLGPSFLFSMNKNTPCLTRYGKTSINIIPIGKTSKKKMEDSIVWICNKEREGITWDRIPGKVKKKYIDDLLIVYLEEKPEVKISFAKAFGSSDNSIQSESRFENATGSLLDALRLHEEIKQESKLKLFILNKVDDGRRQVIQDRTFTIAELKKAIVDWKDAVEQSFKIQIPESKFEKIKNPYIPLPAEFMQVLQRQWIRNGSEQSKVPISISMSEIFDLFLNREYNLELQCTFYLRTLWQRASNLLIECGHYLHRDKYFERFKKPEETKYILQTISVFNILLYKLNLQKENSMKNSYFLIGQFLSLSDRLHKEYCIAKRDGSIPPQLIGNSHFQVMVQNPAQGFDRIKDRLKIYQAWAFTDGSPISKWVLKHLSIVCSQLPQDKSEFPAIPTEKDKALILMGYLAKIEGEDK